MGALAGILNYAKMAGQTLPGSGTTPLATSTGGSTGTGSSNSSASSATISANDFLSLLVTEMQNQDPTADTDPNEYINQLVQVNSLEQLIDINQNLSTALGQSPTGTSGTSTQSASATTSSSSLTGRSLFATPSVAPATHPAGGAAQTGASAVAGSRHTTQAAAAKHVPGNLSVPDANPAAQSVARGLDGHARPHLSQGGLPMNR